MTKVPASFLSECFTYSPESGLLFWKHRPISHFPTKQGWHYFDVMFAGKVAGAQHSRNGRPKAIAISIHYGGKQIQLLAHQVIYAIMGVCIPEGLEVDHQDGNPFNNRWDNLRLATPSQNGANRRRNVEKKSGLPKGVYKKGGRFEAAMRSAGKYIYCGSFPTPEAAHIAYCCKAQELFGEFARFN